MKSALTCPTGTKVFVSEGSVITPTIKPLADDITLY